MQRGGHLSRQEGLDARSAIASRMVEAIVTNPEAYRAALKNGALNQWMEMADGPDIAGESADGKAARHEAAYKKVRGGSVDLELAKYSTPERLRAAYDIAQTDTPEVVAAARRLLDMEQRAPGDLDEKPRNLTDAERERIAATIWFGRNAKQIFEQPEMRAALEQRAAELDKAVRRQLAKRCW